ncbi:MAG TPA: hypothetical protein DCL61_01450 [Cyanobacteria bacterium UBA12227]|nr:hypothetical protein [Cyanobacteria bacterium UBA12227]HAX85737.1 hypothetical protein [Cyanobacteria bacterium UBA11370]HBY81587.1 hypothetical protein [Cyanobacteria bacterium UBA11148]
MSDHKRIHQQIEKDTFSHSPTPAQHPFKTRGFGNGMQVRSPNLPVTNLLQTRPVSSSTQQASQPQETPDLQTQLKQAEQFGYNGLDVPTFAIEATPPRTDRSLMVTDQVVHGINAARIEETSENQTVRREEMEEDELREKPEVGAIQRQKMVEVAHHTNQGTIMRMLIENTKLKQGVRYKILKVVSTKKNKAFEGQEVIYQGIYRKKYQFKTNEGEIIYLQDADDIEQIDMEEESSEEELAKQESALNEVEEKEQKRRKRKKNKEEEVEVEEEERHKRTKEEEDPDGGECQIPEDWEAMLEWLQQEGSKSSQYWSDRKIAPKKVNKLMKESHEKDLACFNWALTGMTDPITEPDPEKFFSHINQTAIRDKTWLGKLKQETSQKIRSLAAEATRQWLGKKENEKLYRGKRVRAKEPSSEEQKTAQEKACATLIEEHGFEIVSEEEAVARICVHYRKDAPWSAPEHWWVEVKGDVDVVLQTVPDLPYVEIGKLDILWHSEQGRDSEAAKDYQELRFPVRALKDKQYAMIRREMAKTPTKKKK